LNDCPKSYENGLILFCLTTANEHFKLSIGIELKLNQVVGNGLEIFLKVFANLISGGQMFLFVLIEKVDNFFMCLFFTLFSVEFFDKLAFELSEGNICGIGFEKSLVLLFDFFDENGVLKVEGSFVDFKEIPADFSDLKLGFLG
jgi:hypothetical protein